MARSSDETRRTRCRESPCVREVRTRGREEAVKNSPPMARSVMEMYASGRELKSIGAALGVSRSRAYQLLKLADVMWPYAASKARATNRDLHFKGKPTRIKFFTGTVRRWLRTIGFEYCARGRHASPLEHFPGAVREGRTEQIYCTACNTRRCKEKSLKLKATA